MARYSKWWMSKTRYLPFRLHTYWIVVKIRRLQIWRQYYPSPRHIPLKRIRFLSVSNYFPTSINQTVSCILNHTEVVDYKLLRKINISVNFEMVIWKAPIHLHSEGQIITLFDIQISQEKTYLSRNHHGKLICLCE